VISPVDVLPGSHGGYDDHMSRPCPARGSCHSLHQPLPT
jgi:hypothetical protein